MQDTFLPKEGSHVKDKDDLIEEILELLTWAHKENVPVLQFEYEGLGATTSKIETYLRQMNRVKKLSKNKDNGFDGKSAVEAVGTLKNWNAHDLIISGVNADYCVRSTAKGALDKGFAVWSAATIVATFSTHEEYPAKNWGWTSNSQFHLYDNLVALFSVVPIDFVN